jgi:branched-chain amino acid transport system permease protein
VIPRLTRLVALIGALGIGWAVTARTASLGLPTGIVVRGALQGLGLALPAVAICLAWRVDRVINLAAGGVGGLGAVVAVGLASKFAVPWTIAMLAGVGCGAVAASIVGLAVLRLGKAPRITALVATIGLGSVASGGASLAAEAFAGGHQDGTFTAPVHVSLTIGPVRFDGDALALLVLSVGCLAATGWWLTRSRSGLAVRAVGANRDRARLAGIPVARLSLVVWAVGGALAALALSQREALTGVASPLAVAGGSTSFLVRVLAAAVIGGFDDLAAVACVAVAIGIVDESATWVSAQTTVVDVIIAAGVLLSLLARRERSARSFGGTSSWFGAAPTTRSLPPVVRQWLGPAVVAPAAALPLVLSPANAHGFALVWVTALLAVSVVVVTGWSGQVTLATLSVAGVGAAVMSALYGRHGWDVTLAIGVGVAVSATVSVLVGLPALRVRTPVLSVATLAFASAASTWLLVGDVHPWLLDENVTRPKLFGRLPLHQEWQMYELCLVGLIAGWSIANRLRHSRAGRSVLAVRDDGEVAAATGISVLRARLGAHAVAGGLAGLAGCLLVLVQQGFQVESYDPSASIEVLAGAVVGGVDSLPGALAGAGLVRAAQVLLPGDWAILASGLGLSALVLLFPQGLAGAAALTVDFIRRPVAAEVPV